MRATSCRLFRVELEPRRALLDGFGMTLFTVVSFVSSCRVITSFSRDREEFSMEEVVDAGCLRSSNFSGCEAASNDGEEEVCVLAEGVGKECMNHKRITSVPVSRVVCRETVAVSLEENTEAGGFRMIVTTFDD